MNRLKAGLAFCIAAFAMGAAAQTVTSSGTKGTVNNVPYISAATSTSTTLGVSPITVSGSNVGIGTTSPSVPLQVTKQYSGNTNTSMQTWDPNLTGYGLTLSNYNSTAGIDYRFTQLNGGTSYPVLTFSYGNVGIGTTAPAAKLDVGDTSGNGTLETVFARLGEGNNTGDGTYLGVKGWSTQPAAALSFSIEHHFYGQTNSSINFYRGGSTGGGFMTFATSTNTEQMRITANGNVGIGTTSPNAKLEVNGGLRFTSDPSGTVQTTAWTGTLCGGDYAESVDVTGSRTNYEPGDVMVLDADNPGKILRSIEAYSTAVSGIYSTKPGAVGRRQITAKSPDEVPMAVVGIVPAKVSAENGSVKVGDLLVTSSTPGFAMKGTDRSRMLGAVVGKAMGSLETGTGVIEVLVTLQ